MRVNRLALSLLRVWNNPLPVVLKEEIMDPIGASDTWVWHGYRNSYVQLNGRAVQSVSGGSHWGGGLWASTRDHARFGYLFLRNGNWNGGRSCPNVGADGDDAHRHRASLRLLVVAQHRAQDCSQRAGVELLRPRLRWAT